MIKTSRFLRLFLRPHQGAIRRLLQCIQLFHAVFDILHQQVGQIESRPLTNNNTHDYHILHRFRHRVSGHLPALYVQSIRQIVQSPFPVWIIFQFPDEQRVRHIITEELENTHLFQLLFQVKTNVKAILLHLLVSLLTQAHELVILGQNLVTRTREIDGNTRYIGTQIIHGKVHLLGQILLVFPNHPAHRDIPDRTCGRKC